MRLITLFILGAIFFSSCSSVGFHDYAEYNPEKAAKLIKRLKNDTLLVAYPTYQEKEKIVRSALKQFPESKKKLWKDLEDVKNDRESNMKTIVSAFNENFTFCRYLFIPDSLVHAFEKGEDGPFFLGKDNKLDPKISYSNRSPFKYVHRSDTKWEFVIKNDLLPNPFPNHVFYRNNLLELLGVEDFGVIFKKITNAFQRRLEKFYSNPTRAVRY